MHHQVCLRFHGLNSRHAPPSILRGHSFPTATTGDGESIAKGSRFLAVATILSKKPRCQYLSADLLSYLVRGRVSRGNTGHSCQPSRMSPLGEQCSSSPAGARRCSWPRPSTPKKASETAWYRFCASTEAGRAAVTPAISVGWGLAIDQQQEPPSFIYLPSALSSAAHVNTSMAGQDLKKIRLTASHASFVRVPCTLSVRSAGDVRPGSWLRGTCGCH